jgi:hypothetical protein
MSLRAYEAALDFLSFVSVGLPLRSTAPFF